MTIKGETPLSIVNSQLSINKMELPKDPMMLLSLINMKLRDFYPSLDALCDDLDIDKQALTQEMQKAGFEYNPAQNKFW